MIKKKTDTFIPLVSLVVPVFNESETVEIFLKQIDEVFKKNNTKVNLEIVFVNDGSVDDTLHKLLSLQQLYLQIRIVDLSRNFGKEAALTAGIESCNGDVVVPIDVDLQDPPIIILNMLEKWREGFEVVLAKRINRSSDSWLKRFSAKWFYKTYNKIANYEIPENIGDFRLMDRKVINALKQIPETQRFMKGIFAWVGFKTTVVDYNRQERIAGKSKFSGWKLWNFALDGFTSFSTLPLRLWTFFGLIIAILSIIFAFAIVIRSLFYGIDVPGYASIIVTITFLGGMQFVGLGVIGEYIGRNYLESKRRPIYIVRHIYNPDS